MTKVSSAELDAILALQLVVAWAGEGLCDPPRLGWWRTALADPDWGGYIFQEFFPKTHQWAALEAIRQTAIAIDANQRQASFPQPDNVRTLFFWGFDLDEQLSDRLLEHKQSGKAVKAVLDLPVDLEAAFVAADFEAVLQALGVTPKVTIAPGGRQVEGIDAEVWGKQARCLAAALLPLHENYPMPFYRLAEASV